MSRADLRPQVVVSAPELHALMQALLMAFGCPEDIAKTAADIHLEADLRGIGLQGLDYMPYTLKSIESGQLIPDGRPAVIRSTPATALVDGNRGPGQVAAMMAVHTLCEKASTQGAAAVGITNSADIFMIGYYAEQIARKQLVGLVFTAGPPLVHPYGGVERMLSTNPVAFGIPTGGPNPLVFDMSTSAMSSARIRQAAYHGEQLPPGIGVDADGNPSTDARAIRQGAIAPLAGHKGFGLALCIAMLAGPLTGSGIGPDLAGWVTGEVAPGMGHCFLAVDPAAFGEIAAFNAAVDAYIHTIRTSRTAEDVDAIRFPGERAFAEREKRLRSGVPILAATWNIVSQYAQRFELELPPTIDQES